MERSENISEELYSRIENYLMQRMTEEERISFEDQITSDSELAKKVYEIRLLLLGKIPSSHEKIQKNKQVKALRWAVTIIIVAAVIIWIFFIRN